MERYLYFFETAIKNREPTLTDPHCLDYLFEPTTDQHIDKLLQLLDQNQTVDTLFIAGAHIDKSMFLKILTYNFRSDDVLTKLYFDRNPIGSDSFIALCDVLMENRSVTEIDVSRCGIGPDGWMRFSEVIRCVDCKLVSVKIGLNNIDKDSAAAIFDAMMLNRSIKKLDMSSIMNSGFGDAMCKDIERLLLENDVLTHLDVSACYLEDIQGIFRGIRGNRVLKEIDLGFNRCGSITSEMIEMLECNDVLEKVFMNNSEITKLARFPMNGIEFYLSSSTGIFDDTHTQEEMDMLISSMRFCKKLNLLSMRISENIIESILSVLEESDQLVALDLRLNKLRTSSIVKLTQYLEKNTTLKDLRITISNAAPILDTVMLPLGQSIQNHTSLHFFEISYNDQFVSEHFISLLLKSTLEKLVLDVNIGGTIEPFITADMLLKSLDLNLSNVNPATFNALMEGITYNTTLEDFTIVVDAFPIDSVVKFVKNNISVTKFTILGNYGDEECTFAYSLCDNTTIRSATSNLLTTPQQLKALLLNGSIVKVNNELFP